MSENSDIHKFVMGDIRADGWKSQWRRDLEKKLAQPLPAYERPEVIAPIKRTEPKPSRFCSKGCGRRLSNHNRCGICESCPRSVERPLCIRNCGRHVGPRNQHGVCNWCPRWRA